MLLVRCVERQCNEPRRVSPIADGLGPVSADAPAGARLRAPMARPAPVDAPAVAAFDLDGTLTHGGSVVHWLTAVGGGSLVRQALLQHAGALAVGAIRSGLPADA